MKVKLLRRVMIEGESFDAGQSVDVSKDRHAELVSLGVVRDPNAQEEPDTSSVEDAETEAAEILAQAKEEASKLQLQADELVKQAQQEAEKIAVDARSQADELVKQAEVKATEITKAAREAAKTQANKPK